MKGQKQKILASFSYPFFRKHAFILLYVGIVGVATLFRVYLALTLPIWHDEAYSIWASQNTYVRILSGATDPVHPPGYYLFLKLWSILSHHLFWFRVSSIFAFIFNTWLIKKLGDLIHRTVSFLFLFLYCFSGYFIIFDWQVRMYTFVLSFILLSLLFLEREYSSKRLQYRSIFPLVVINALGLYVDYAFLWYFLPLLPCFIFLSFTNTNIKHRIVLLSLCVSGAIFYLLHKTILETYSRGIAGIGWMEPYLKPSFFIPYFLGTHRMIGFTVVYAILVIVGVVIFFRRKLPPVYPRIIIFTATFSTITTLLYSYMVTPLFHVRSLVIVALACLFFVTLAAYALSQRFGKYFLAILLFYWFTNFVLIVQTLPYNEGQFLVSYLPWKYVASKIKPEQNTLVVYRVNQELPTPLLLWSLKYTLSGQESLPVKSLPFRQYDETTDTTKCSLMNQQLIEIFLCDK